MKRTFETDKIVTPNTRKNLSHAEKLKRDGFVIIPDMANSERLSGLLTEIWDTLCALPAKPEYRLKPPPGGPLAAVAGTSWLKTTLTKWFPGSFGAPVVPPFFHLKSSWQLRQEEDIYKVFAEILECDELWVTIDRVGVRLPGEGEDSFLHWDSDPWFWSRSRLAVQGLIALNDTEFLCVPGSCTDSFAEKFKRQYRSLAPTKKSTPRPMLRLPSRAKKQSAAAATAGHAAAPAAAAGAASSADDEDCTGPEHDPMNLAEQVQCIPVPAGAMLIWSNRLLHTTQRNHSPYIRHVQYISYTRAGDTDASPQYRRMGVDERADRLRSYETGMRPQLFPGGNTVEYVPRLWWVNFPDKVDAYARRWLPPQSERTYQSGKRAGQSFAYPVEYDPRVYMTYVPPLLTPLGRRLLGAERWPSQCAGDGDGSTEQRSAADDSVGDNVDSNELDAEVSEEIADVEESDLDLEADD